MAKYNKPSKQAISPQRFQSCATGVITKEHAQHGALEGVDVKPMDDQTFAKIVAEEVKNKLSPNQRKILLAKENWERWRLNLVALLENIDTQIEMTERSRDEDTSRYTSFGNDGMTLLDQANESYDVRIKKISRFRFHVERRLNEVASMIETGEVAQSSGWESVEFLKRGITKHRAMLRDFDLEDTAIDRSLWDTLDNKWTFDEISEDSL
jgi:succinylglutamate desuccinylase